MVWIIKNDGSYDHFIKRIAALMLNMEYNKHLYNTHTADYINDNKKFNVVDYKYHSDTYSFNRGFLLILCNSDAKRRETLQDIMGEISRIDVKNYADTYVPINKKKVVTTQHTLLWSNNPIFMGRQFLFKGSGLIFNRIDKSPCFVWTRAIFAKNIEFSELSTIVADINNVIKNDVSESPIQNTLIYQHKLISIQQILPKSSEYIIHVSGQFGVQDIFSRSDVYFLYDKKYIYMDYDFCDIYEYENSDIVKGDKTNLLTKISNWNMCIKCQMPMYEKVYLTEKDDKYFMLCKFCYHVYDNDYKVDYVTDIPRSFIETIDLLEYKHLKHAAKRVPKNAFENYKNDIKIIHSYFPKYYEDIMVVENVVFYRLSQTFKSLKYEDSSLLHENLYTNARWHSKDIWAEYEKMIQYSDKKIIFIYIMSNMIRVRTTLPKNC